MGFLGGGVLVAGVGGFGIIRRHWAAIGQEGSGQSEAHHCDGHFVGVVQFGLGFRAGIGPSGTAIGDIVFFALGEFGA